VLQLLEQLEINQTFFIQLALFFVLFTVLPSLFKPYVKLFEARNQKLTKDKLKAEQMSAQADAAYEDYRKQVTLAKNQARLEFDSVVEAAKKEESITLQAARTEAKQIQQTALEQLKSQTTQLKAGLSTEVSQLTSVIVEKITKGLTKGDAS
jgi:F0F1-type ATP synthase membrane subunit b/b'